MKKRSYWLRKEWTWYYVAFIVCLVGVILFTVYHKQIVAWLRPAADWMHDLPYGWTIPIGILFVISFPPLFGHEIVAILCGLVWGLWAGFGIVAAGTFLGEVGNFYAFKYCCAARGEKLEKTKLQYACLARVVREGGFKIALIARLSAIPGHFTTAVFSTCGMSIWTFAIAAILSLPKQFITVYLGVALEQSEDGTSNTRDTIIKDVVLGVTTLITIGAMWYIYHKMNQAKPHVIYDRRKARQAKLAMSAAPGSLPYANPAVLESTASVVFNPTASDAEIPLTASAGARTYQQWDPQGRAVYAPQPHRPAPQRQLTGEGYAAQQRAAAAAQRTSPLPPGAGYPYPYPYPTSQIPMQRVTTSPPRDPFADSARVDPGRQPVGTSYQRQAPPRGYGSPPPDAFRAPAASQAQRTASPPPPPLRPPPVSAPQTPTQASYFQPPPGAPPVPVAPSAPAYADPFEDPVAAAMPNPYERSGGTGRHAAEATDATFYTATDSSSGAHSRDVSLAAEEESPYAAHAYESGAGGRSGGGPAGHGPPPAYSAAPP
ncbi:hypothetical protein PYCCODRAFT_1447767 [Trametes coccinea BRFM310]|uniref:Golgi apparatus membrane protein TVP38 n=1 Tax=Trametes coccinea (strain BRFM310) TaxID=1353009 RepID=A0A1Y2IBP9_TRAC3|nr:hypothetical protein PYCCODRAFT_1447767 [Trametes coccinea BRFM310]